MWKFIKYSLLAILIAATVLVTNAIWFKPFSIRVFYDRTMLEQAMESPQTLTYLGLFDQFGIRGHNAELDDTSIAKADEGYAELKETYATFQSYGREGRVGQDLISYDIFDYFLSQQIEGEKWRYHSYSVNQMTGPHVNLPSFMTDMHRVEDRQGAEHYVARLQAFKPYFDGVLAKVDASTERGIIPPRFVVDAVIDQLQGFIEPAVTDNVLVTSLRDKLAKTEMSAAQQQELVTQAETAVREQVYPAYRDMLGYFVALAPKATVDAGVWKLPNGDDYYAYQLKQFTTENISADQVHQTGLDEVARIHAEMRVIFDGLGYDSETPIGTLLQQLNADPQFLYEDSAAGREQILADYTAILSDIDKLIDQAFRKRPQAELEVVRVPEYAERNSAGAYYQAPSLDGSRPGRFYANLYDITATPKYGMKTLAVHEGVPGHHYQIALQQEMSGLPIFRSFVPFSVHTEGWALYTEQLMADLGFYQNDPYGDIGRLQAELFRAIRLVVDTGMHAKRWTRDEAINYMAANGGMAMSDVVAEIERYIVWPGQAVSYKMGMMKFVELREKAKRELGDKFDIRDFHDVILESGSMPLPILERLIDEYIQQKAAAAA